MPRRSKRAPYKYTAHSNDPEVIERALDKLEGELQRLREMPPKKRPSTLPAKLIADHLTCSPATVKRWVAYHDARRSDSELSDRFCDLYTLICNELGEKVLAGSFAIATDTGNSQSFRAQQWLLKLIDPATFDERRAEDAPAEQIADIPSEVLDALSDEQKQVLADAARQHDALDFKVDKMLAEVAAQVAASDPDEDQ